MSTDEIVHDHLIQMRGLRFHYPDWGDADRPPLILLHAYTQHSRIWDTTVRGLIDRFRVLAPDQRGHGETDWPAEYGCEIVADDLEAFRVALSIDRFRVIGFSIGGHVTMVYAAKYPERVERAVIMEAIPEPRAEARSWLRAYLEPPDVFADEEEAIAINRAGMHRADKKELCHWVVNNLMRREDGRLTYR